MMVRQPSYTLLATTSGANLMATYRFMMTPTNGLMGRPSPMSASGPAYFRCDTVEDRNAVTVLMWGDLAFVVETGQLYVYNNTGWASMSGQGEPDMNPIDAWPVGSVFLSMVPTDPATMLGGGTWSRIANGRMVVGQDDADTDFDAAGDVGVDAHSPHDTVSHLPPFFTVYIWQRTA